MLSLNRNKSCCVYFGARYNADVDDHMLDDDKITENSSFIYLGIQFVKGKSIGVNIEPIRHIFFISCNNILNHSSDLCDLVYLQLHESYVKPTLTYAAAEIKLSEAQIASLTTCWNSVYRRILHFNRCELVKCFIRGLCRFDFRHLCLQLSTKRYLSLQLCKNSVVRDVFKLLFFQRSLYNSGS